MIKTLAILLFVLTSSNEIFGICSNSASCKIKNQHFYRMCSCNSSNPTYCTRNGKCKSCILVSGTCRSDSGPCCPISNGKSFCNTKTDKCEAIRYCTPNSPCAYNDLSASEIQSAITVVKNSGQFSSDINFPIVRTQEPSKSQWNSGSFKNHRIAYLSVFDYKDNLLSEVLVDLQKKSLIKKAAQKNILPPEMDREVKDAAEIAMNDPRVIDAYKKRGLNISYAAFDYWTVGASGPFVNLPGKRILREVGLYQDPFTRYSQWRPVEGLNIVIDLNKGVVDEFVDIETDPIAPVYQILPTFQSMPPLKPLTISQPDGSSIKVEGQQITWYKWKLLYSMDPMHGLQLFQVRYQADCEDRPVLHKISIGEMFVPYGAKSKTWRFKNAFDAGEYGLGKSALPLIIGKDLPENSLLFDCIIANESSVTLITIPGCIGMYEEDQQILYKHSEFGDRKMDGRRGRVMVLTFFANIGNYDYGYDYIFHMDGVIQIRVRLTGIVLSRGVKQEFNDKKCIEDCNDFVNDYLVGQPHQHFFNYRIDFDVDGINNNVAEIDVTNDPFDTVNNLDVGAFSPKLKVLKREGFRDYNVENSRSWQVFNGNSRNKFKSPRGFIIKPADIAYSYMHSGNQYLSQAEFVKHPFWVTVFKDDEQSPAGNFPRYGQPYKGLPKFVKDKESIEDEDVVVWYTLGLTHIPSPEQWPLMNVETAGFFLIPYNFLSQNSEIPLKGKCP